jgi:hypothetical protein
MHAFHNLLRACQQATIVLKYYYVLFLTFSPSNSTKINHCALASNKKCWNQIWTCTFHLDPSQHLQHHVDPQTPQKQILGGS